MRSALIEGKDELAESQFTISLELFRKADDNEGIACTLTHLGSCALNKGKLNTAFSQYSDSYYICERSEFSDGMVQAVRGLIRVSAAETDDRRKLHHYRFCLEYAREIEDHTQTVRAFEGISSAFESPGEEAISCTIKGICETYCQRAPKNRYTQFAKNKRRELINQRQNLADTGLTKLWNVGRSMSDIKAYDYIIAEIEKFTRGVDD